MKNYTSGPVFRPLSRFVVPVFIALTLQFLYGAIDLWVVGRFAQTADISGVAIGSQITQAVTGFLIGMAVGVTVLTGQQIGAGDIPGVSRTIGNGIFLFGALSVVITALMLALSETIIRLMGTPEEACCQAYGYIRICSVGTVFIAAYNFLCSAFKGVGDSRAPMVSVIVASLINCVGDLLFVAGLGWGAAGAAAATVLAQAFSVICILLLMRRPGSRFWFPAPDLQPDPGCIFAIVRIGLPAALQNFLLNLSFLINRSFVNALGLYASAGVGISSKLSYIIMLVPESYMQGVATFAAQNIGAGKPARARKALFYASAASFAACAGLFYPNFFYGHVLTSLFTRNARIAAAAADYFRGAAIDSLLTAFSFCLIGYFNGCGMTRYVLLQGLIAAFCVRTPVAYYYSHLPDPNLFCISLGSPAATAVQLVMHMIVLRRQLKNERKIAALYDLSR